MSGNLTRNFLDNIHVEQTLNSDENNLPFGYFHPQSEGKLIWMCNYDQDGKITGVFQFSDRGESDRRVNFIDTLEQAIHIKNELVSNGWKKIIPPKIEFTMKNDDGTERTLNRKERRILAKKARKIREQLNAQDEPLV